jgi:transposase-like protein
VPVAKSPVDAFRELLAMDALALRAALSNRTEQSRARLVKKINEYKSMDADERALRLLNTELRWYLLQLMPLPATNRVERLADIRSNLRSLIEDRLTRWDALDAELREPYLHNEQALSLVLQMASASDRMRTQLVAEVPPQLRDTVNRALARLDDMSPADRQRSFRVLENIFTMTPAEKEKVLRGVMSEPEKNQMAQTLADFSQLTLEQRKTCLRSFEKFTGMTREERALFLRNVQTWEKMTPKERQQWREVVKNVEILPPLPEIKIQLPPEPPDPTPRVTTNRIKLPIGG